MHRLSAHASCAQFVGECFRRWLRRAVMHGDIGTSGRETTRNARTDAAGCPGDQHSLPTQVRQARVALHHFDTTSSSNCGTNEPIVSPRSAASGLPQTWLRRCGRTLLGAQLLLVHGPRSRSLLRRNIRVSFSLPLGFNARGNLGTQQFGGEAEGVY